MKQIKDILTNFINNSCSYIYIYELGKGARHKNYFCSLKNEGDLVC